MSGYIGSAPVPQSVQTRDSFIATAGQTSFGTSGYEPNFLDVYLNGIKLHSSDYTASNGTDIVLSTGAAVNDVLEVVAFDSFELVGELDAAKLDGELPAHYLDFGNTTNKPTTLSGYGITDAATSAQGALADSALQSYTVTEGDVTGHQAALSITESQISDLGTYETADATILKDADIGVNVEAYDSTILKDADIGVNVQAYDANIVSDATYVKTDENFTTADHTKLDGIEANATADQTKTDIDALNIDADTLDGQHGSYYTGYADTAVANLVDSSPAALDTLNELAAALGDDPNFATTMTNALAGKVDDSQVLTNVPSGALFTDTNTTYSVGDGGLTEKNFTTADNTKLDGISANARTGTIVETGTTFNGNYPAYFRIGENSAYSHPNITFTGSTSTLNTGNIAVTGTVDGRDVATDGTKLDGIATSANNYVHPTSAGNKHIPSGGSSGQMLQYASSGTAQWADAAGGSGVSATMLFDHKGTFTWTTPSACKVMIQAVGAGGSGGTVVSQASSSTNASAIAQGGSGGGYARSIVNLAANTTITMNIGEGGNGRVNGIAWNNNTVRAYSGYDGGNTTVTASGLTTMTANGGDGGQASGNSSSFTHPAFSTASAGGTASGGTEANITGTAAVDLSSATTLSTRTHLFLPPASFHSGFDNSRGLPSLANVVAANSDSDPIRYSHFGSHIEQSWINYTRGNYFGTALNSHVRGNMPRMTGSEDHSTDSTADDGNYSTRVPGASFTQKGGTENQGLNANNVQPGPATYGTGSGGGIHCANGFTGSKTARSADGGDGFVLITVLDI